MVLNRAGSGAVEPRDMNLPFTPDQFFDVFAQYNRSFGSVALLWWIGSATALMTALWRPREWTGPLIALLAALWFWNAGVYHALLFTAINPAAWVFAMLFAIEGVLLSWAGARGGIGWLCPRAPLSTAGAVLAIYALAYPLANLALGHPYPHTPTFGVPCPTTILTIGVLLMLRDHPPLALVLVPGVWAVIGGASAWLFGVWTDIPLLVAGGLLIADRFIRRRRRLERYA